MIRTGHPTIGIFNRVVYDPGKGCLIWTGYKNKRGYGVVQFNGKIELAHRVMAHLFMGFDLNSGLQVLHACDTPACVNKKHFFFGTHEDNMRDMNRKKRNGMTAKTHCNSGHPLDGRFENGWRYCKTCSRERARERWRAKHPGFKPYKERSGGYV